MFTQNRIFRLTSILIILSFLLTSCRVIAPARVKISIVYGSEKQEWMAKLTEQFNAEEYKTADGKIIQVDAIPMGSIESSREIIAETLKPTVWSPASSIYIPITNAEWKKTHPEDLVVGDPNDLVLSPVVIAMWKPMAEALGWPQEQIGWSDIAALATSNEGWAAYGYPEWGLFKFGHTHPEYSNSGIVSIIAQAYAGANKQKGLTTADVRDPKLIQFMRDIESSIIHYGTSTGFFATRLFENGPSYLSAAVIYENLVVAQESKRLNGETSQLPIVAIYPKEGTFWSNHPYAILNAPWVTEEQKEAALVFEDFLLDAPQQIEALRLGFRPADPSLPLTAPLDQQHGVNSQQPQTILQVPTAEVINEIQTLWKATKKPVDLHVVIDVSGSMSGERISAARASLVQFIEMLDDRDRIEITTFSSDIITISSLSEVGPKRADITRRVSGIIEGGNTRLYDAVMESYTRLEQVGNPKHIRAVVVLSDGKDTASTYSISDLQQEIGSNGEEGGNAIKLFTIGYGEDADQDILRFLAEMTGGKQYNSSPENIKEIYTEIATFF